MASSSFPSSESSDQPDHDATDASGAIVIRDVERLVALRANVLRSARPLRIEIPGVAADRARSTAERIVAFANECGCSMGAKSMAATFSISVICLAISHGFFNSQFAWRLPWAFLWAIAGAIAGKVMGIALARRRLRNEINGVIAAMAAQEI